jgi:hypothetical protein
MSGPALPDPPYLTFPEAVALVSPSLEEGDIRKAIARALCEGRLLALPTPIWTARDAADLLAAARTDADKELVRALAARNFIPSFVRPDVWQARFAEGRVNWRNGEVVTVTNTSQGPAVRVETPQFERTAIAALFGAAAASHSDDTGRAAGRPEGTGFAAKDRLLVDKMKDARERGEANSWADAARMVVHQADGGGSEDSKIKRLVRFACGENKGAK